MLKIGQNWVKIANYTPPPNAQQKFAPLFTTLAPNRQVQNNTLCLLFAERAVALVNFCTTPIKLNLKKLIMS